MPPPKLQSLLASAIGCHRAGRLAQAETLYRQARLGAPKNFDVLHLSGLLAYQQGRVGEAVDLLFRAHRIDRGSAVCEMRLALALMAARRVTEAETHFRAVVKNKPDLHEGWDNLAYCLKLQDRLAEAVTCHARAVALKPDFAAGWFNYGLTLSLHGRVFDALDCHERALAADPMYALARYGRAQALHQAHRIEEAVEEYGRFIAIRPDHLEARSYRLFALHNLDRVTREDLFSEHLAFGAAVGRFPEPVLPNRPEPGRRLRLAILSPDLRAHSCAYFIEPLLRHLDPAQFEVYLYHDHFREDAVSGRLKACAAVWRNFVGQPGAVVEQAIRGDAPDILIDLAGHTGMTNRLPLFARRLAPVQMTYLGYPNTTGLSAMDYRLTDGRADPAGEADAFATEKLVRFPVTAWTYAPPADAPQVGAPPCLDGRAPVFGCFNNLAKITDRMLGVWGRLLRTVPGARLVLKGRGLGDASAHVRYHERFVRCGLPPAQVDLLERTADTASHLELYRRVDVALDSFPYHGTTTTCEALWMGLPVVSLCGDRHVSRVGASLLGAVGRPEWVAANDDEYIRIARDLATSPAGLSTLRDRLRSEMSASPLLDHRGQAGCFGVLLRNCWRRWCGEITPPDEPTPP